MERTESTRFGDEATDSRLTFVRHPLSSTDRVGRASLSARVHVRGVADEWSRVCKGTLVTQNVIYNFGLEACTSLRFPSLFFFFFYFLNERDTNFINLKLYHIDLKRGNLYTRPRWYPFSFFFLFQYSTSLEKFQKIRIWTRIKGNESLSLCRRNFNQHFSSHRDLRICRTSEWITPTSAHNFPPLTRANVCIHRVESKSYYVPLHMRKISVEIFHKAVDYGVDSIKLCHMVVKLETHTR